MSKIIITKSKLESVASKIRSKSGASQKLTFEQMESELDNLMKIPTGTLDITENGEYDVTDKASVNVEVASSGGGVDYLGLRLSQTEEYEYSNNEITSVAEYGFYKDTKITNINLPSVRTVKKYAFQGCTSLQNISIPNLKSVTDYSFDGSAITKLDLPELIAVHLRAFSNTKITEINLPKLNFSYNVNINSIFANCKKLKTVNLPLLEVACSSMLNGCTSLENVPLPKLKRLCGQCFEGCTNLKSVYIPEIEIIYRYEFRNCTNLEAIIITRTDGIPTIEGSSWNPTSNSPLANYYVPDNLVDSYKAATNWAAYASKIKGLSELPQEYADLYGIEIPEAPAGYTLTLSCDSDILNNEYKLYSLDNGNTWLQFTSETMVLQNVTQIKFSELSAGAYRLQVGTTSGGNDVADILGYESENITISATTTLYVHEAAGGGYD